MGSDEDMFGYLKIVKIIDPIKEFHFARSWKEAMETFEKLQEEGKEWGVWGENKMQCWQLTNNLLFSKVWAWIHNNIKQVFGYNLLMDTSFYYNYTPKNK